MSQYNFEISDRVLRSAFYFNNMSLDGLEDKMIIFGIRGALPGSPIQSILDYTAHTQFEASHIMQRVVVDYYYPRCVIGLWLPTQKKVAVFPGSTVPNLKVIQRNNKQSHQFNCMQLGLYTYRKGQHPLSGFQPHRALRLVSSIVLRRANYTINNGQPVINYDSSATISVGNPGDNIHCARNNPSRTLVRFLKKQDYSVLFCMQDYYSSYGCQVIVGQAPQYIPSGQINGNWNAWDIFIKNVYELYAPEQTEFKYLLLDSLDIQQLDQATTSDPTLFKIRYGSSGGNVENLQRQLKTVQNSLTGQTYYKGTINGDFGPSTAKALIDFEKDCYGGRAYSCANSETMRRLRAPFSTTH